MGSFFSKEHWDSCGYYPDMVCGFITRTGDGIKMVKFPKVLQELPEKCPNCHNSKDLIWKKMMERLYLKRQEYQTHVESIIARRIENGEADPYPKDDNKKDYRVCRLNPLAYFQRNIVSPSIDETDDEDDEDPFRFLVDINDLIVCRCMLHSPEKFAKVQQPTINMTVKAKEIFQNCDSGDCTNSEIQSSSQRVDIIPVELTAILHPTPANAEADLTLTNVYP